MIPASDHNLMVTIQCDRMRADEIAAKMPEDALMCVVTVSFRRSVKVQRKAVAAVRAGILTDLLGYAGAALQDPFRLPSL